MNLALRFTALSSIALLFPGVLRAATEQQPPNLIVIVTDDHGYADVGFNGCKDIPTPNLDSIAAGGVRFTNGYVTYSVCGPSRAGLMTGRYQDRFGFCRNPSIDPADEQGGIPLSETTLAEALAPAGYVSMAVGKWHLGTHPTLTPLERGFEEFFGFLSGGHNYFPEQLTLNDLSEVNQPYDWYRTRLLRDRTRVDIDDYLTDELSDAAVEFVERRHDGPFFLYLAYNAPHAPLQATPKYLDRFAHIKNKKRRTYAAMVSAVDDGVGRLLAKVDEVGVADRTIVFFLSDNGGPTRVNGSRNTPLRDGKGSPYEGGVRVPFAAKWPAKFPAGVDYDEPVVSLDIFATITAQAGVDASPDRPLDGVDLTPYVTGAKTGAPHDRLYWRWFDSGVTAMRQGDTKLIAHDQGAQVEAFDLATDIAESQDIAPDRADEVTQMHTQWRSWNEQLEEPAFKPLGSWP